MNEDQYGKGFPVKPTFLPETPDYKSRPLTQLEINWKKIHEDFYKRVEKVCDYGKRKYPELAKEVTARVKAENMNGLDSFIKQDRNFKLFTMNRFAQAICEKEGKDYLNFKVLWVENGG